MSRDASKSIFGVFDQVRHKPACTVIEESWKLEILAICRRGIVLSAKAKILFSYDAAHIIQISLSPFAINVDVFFSFFFFRISIMKPALLFIGNALFFTKHG